MRKWLIEIRDNEGLKPIEMSQKLGISKQFYCDLEKGRKSPSLQLALRMAKILNFDVYKFYEGEEIEDDSNQISFDFEHGERDLVTVS